MMFVARPYGELFILLPQPGYVLSVFVSGITHIYSTDFHKIRWKGCTWVTGERLDFVGKPVHVTLVLGSGRGIEYRDTPGDT